jgi:hypothetical protein
VGGWAGPHPLPTNNAAASYKLWKDWNENVVARDGWKGFDGIDWDMEGANEMSSPTNYFTVSCLDMVGQFAQLAKADGYRVSLVPPESYWDITTPKFDRNLTHNYPDWHPEFLYHSHSSYAYIFSRYNTPSPIDGSPTFDWVRRQSWLEGQSWSGAGSIFIDVTRCSERIVVLCICAFVVVAPLQHLPAVSFPPLLLLTPICVRLQVSVQLYETYSHAMQNITQFNQSPADYLYSYIPRLYAGWTVDFSSDPAVNWPTQHVALNRTQVIIGLANAWTDGTRALFIWPAAAGDAYTRLQAEGQEPRGFMFWVSAAGSAGALPLLALVGWRGWLPRH